MNPLFDLAVGIVDRAIRTGVAVIADREKAIAVVLDELHTVKDTLIRADYVTARKSAAQRLADGEQALPIDDEDTDEPENAQ